MASLLSVPCGLHPSFDLRSSTQWMFHRWNGSLPPLSSLFLLHCYYLFMSVFHSLPPTYTLHQYLWANQSVAFQMSAVTRHSSWSFSQSQYSLISVLPSAKSFDIQGIPGLMHCKFSSIMNCVGRIKGMDMEHTLQRNGGDPEVVKALMNLN